MPFTLILLGIVVAVVLVLLAGSFFTVNQQSVAIVERFGKYARCAYAGLNLKIPFVERIAGIISLRILPLDVVRAEIPTMSLDEVFEKKDTIANAVKNELTGTMQEFGYEIVKALVTNIDPDEKVKNAMNEINEQQRFQ